MIKKNLIIIVCLSCFLCLSADDSFNRSYLYDYLSNSYGAKELGMGNCAAASSDSPAAIFWNPALIGSSKSAQVYVSFVSGSSEFTAEYQNFRDFNSDISYKNIDFAGFTVPFRTSGLNLNIGVAWYRYFPSNYKGTFTEREITADSINKSVTDISGSNGNDVLAFSLSCPLTEYVHAGVTLQHFFNSSKQVFNTSVQMTASSLTEKRKISGNKFILGLNFTPSEGVNMSFAYHFKMRNNYSVEKETMTFTSQGVEKSDGAEIFLPASYTFSFSTRLSKSLLFAYDISKVFWNKSRVYNYFGSAELNYPQMSDPSLKLQTSELRHAFGFEYLVPLTKSILSLRGGLNFARNLYRDMDEKSIWTKGYAFGLGYTVSNIRVDLGYMYRKAEWNRLISDNLFKCKWSSSTVKVSLQYTITNGGY